MGKGKISKNELHDNLKIEIENKVNNTDFESHKADNMYQPAAGTATAITLTINGTLVTGYPITFIASANNNGAATTINGKPLYKPGTTTAPTLIAGKAYTVWYNATSNCFFIKASAEGNTIASHVLAGETFSNNVDVGLVGTAPLKSGITYTPTTSDQTITAGFEDGTCKVKGDANLIASNILSGKSIFGVAGSVTIASLGGRRWANGSFVGNGTKVTISGLQFKPSVILTKITNTSNGSYNDHAVYSTQDGNTFNIIANTADTPIVIASSVVYGSFQFYVAYPSTFTFTWIAIE